MNNTHIVDGRIGAKGAEVCQTKGGKPFIKFSLANDAFIGGVQKTIWYDVTCYDQFIIDNKAERLKKGTPVQVVGTLVTDANVGKDNKIWINNNLTAIKIEIIAFGGGETSGRTEDNKDEMPSTYTGGTKSEKIVKNQHEDETVVTTGKFSMTNEAQDDELPF